MKILLVEDDLEIGAMLKIFLMTENYEVIIAQTGKAGQRSQIWQRRKVSGDISQSTEYKNHIYGQTEKNISLYAPKSWANS